MSIIAPAGEQDTMSYEDIHILIIEDNPGDTRFIREMLDSTEYASADLHLVTSLKEAGEIPIDRASVAMVLLDLGLPDSTGLGTLLAIKALFPDSAIIVLTGSDDLALAIRALQEGAQNYLTKDELNACRLGRTLRFAIERHGFIKRLRMADKAVIDRDRRFQAITDHSADMLTIRDAGGALLYESPVKRKHLGYAVDDVDVPTGFDLVHPDDLAATQAAFAAALSAPGTAIQHSARLVRKNGATLHVKAHITDLLHVPEVQAVISNIHDVTELVEANERMRSSEARLNEAQRLGQIGSWEHRLEARLDPRRVIGYWSDEMYRILGHSPGAVQASFANFLAAVHPDDLELVQHSVLEGIRSARTCSFDHRILRPDGEIRWLHQETSIVHDVLTGRPQRIVGTLQDITERKNSEDRLRASEERFRAMIEGNEDGITLSDLASGVLYSSPSCFRILGYTPEEMLGKGAVDLVPQEDVDRVMEDLMPMFRTPGAAKRVQVKMRHKDGTLRIVDALLTNMLHIPAVCALVTNFRDVTGAVALQEQIAFDRSNLAAMINSTQDLVWSVDRDLCLIAANDAFLNALAPMIGRILQPGENLMMLPVQGAIAPTEHWRPLYQRALSGEAFKLEEHFTEPTEAFVEISYAPIRDQERVVGVAAFSRDVTAIRTAQRDLEKKHREVLESEMEKASILDGVSANIALLDGEGTVVAVNAQWREYAAANGYKNDQCGLGCNYITLSRRSTGAEADTGKEAAEGIQRVLSGELPLFTLEYPCHSPKEERWVRMRVSPLAHSSTRGAVVMHVDITDLRMAHQELQRWNFHLEERVLQRTSELVLVNEELEAETEKSKRLGREVAERTGELLSSINYASGIQRSLIPRKEQFECFADMGLVYRPRDVVSGDFLWCHNTKDHITVVVADCTGHGVPGAMLSMVGHDLLNNIVPRNESLGPKEILTELDRGITSLFLRTKGLNISDGMDLAIAKMDKKTLQLRCSGAGLPVLVVRDGTSTLLPASKVALGGHHVDGCKLFNEFTYQLRTGDRLCLFTDGYADQFGGPAKKKLFRRTFVERLAAQGDQPASEAARSLDRDFMEWKGTLEQVDDVLVLLLDV